MKIKFLLILIISFLFVPYSWAFESFVVKDIKVNGLQRISLGAVLNGLTLKVGDQIDNKRSADIIRSLFQSGFYKDISLERAGDILIVNVDERAAIASISISGNKDIDSDTLKAELKKLGLSESQIFNRSLLDNVEQSLRQQYFSQGKYGMKIVTKVVTRAKNRVDISIQIFEGQAAQIRRINIVGNNVYTDEKLIKAFELAESETISYFSDADKYSQPKLRADLETLRSYYLDRGFINFKILSTQVTISPNKKDIYVTINVTEGEKYFVNKVALAGEMVIPKEFLREKISIAKGDVFSRQQVSLISNSLTERLGDEGYAFTNVNAIPDVDNEKKTVSLTFFVDPGKRVYVRRINITGNDKSDDEVVRREFRQLEGAWYEPKKLNRTRTRLQRLGFFEDLNIETPQVAGTSDQIDINLKVSEGSTGSIQGGIGYGEPRGILFNAKVSLNNFVGTGKLIAFEASNDAINTIYSFTYSNPYHTQSGISRSLSLFLRKTDAGKSNIAAFNLNDRGGRVNYGFPINEFMTARLGVGIQNTTVSVQPSAAKFYRVWVHGGFVPGTGLVKGHGDDFDTVSVTGSWIYDTRDRTFLADDGHLTRFNAELTIPGGDLEYYKFTFSQDSNWNLGRGFTFRMKGVLAFGEAYGDTRELPFFERFYAGGSRSVRGYDGNSLGPRDNTVYPFAPLATNNVIGGVLKVVGNMELIFPLPFVENNRAFRVGAFVDAGNVFLDVDSYDSRELRVAYGVFALWVTPVGVLSFNWGFPVNEKPGDKTELFQFTIGAPF